MNQNNKNMEKIKLYTMNELLDRDLGPIGTPERDEFEQELADELHAYRVGEAIKKAREAQKLTQAELGERMLRFFSPALRAVLKSDVVKLPSIR